MTNADGKPEPRVVFDWLDDEDSRDGVAYDNRDIDDSGFSREGCVLGAECLHHDPYHSSDECFDAEWARAYYGEGETEGGAA